MNLKRMASRSAARLCASDWRPSRCSSLRSATALPAAPRRRKQISRAITQTTSPIKHVIVIIGENRSFDHVFATYVPKNGQTVNNLLSEGIIKLDANKNAIPGPNFDKASNSSPRITALSCWTRRSQPFPEQRDASGLGRWPQRRRDGYFSGANPCGTRRRSRRWSARKNQKTVCRRVLLSGSRQRRHRSDQQDARYAHHECELAACRPVPADQRQHVSLQRLCRQPCPPLLSDVAAGKLQPRRTPPTRILPVATPSCSPMWRTPWGRARMAWRSRRSAPPTAT